MKVKELMTRNAKACTVTTNLAEAAGMMWDNDCGVVPVVADGGKVVGMITDRDICMSVAMNNRNPANLAAEDVMSGKVYSVAAEDDVSKALQSMQDRKVRRLAVVDGGCYLRFVIMVKTIRQSDFSASIRGNWWLNSLIVSNPSQSGSHSALK